MNQPPVSGADLARLAPPPRRVGRLVRLHTVRWGFFPLALAWFLVSWLHACALGERDYLEPAFSIRPTARTNGRISAVGYDRYVPGRHRSSHVYRIRFTYEAGGALREGVCYRTGTPDLRPGARADVEYLFDRPEISRVEGCRYGPTRWWPAWILYGLLFLVFLAIAWFVGRAASRWLGAFAVADAAVSGTTRSRRQSPRDDRWYLYHEVAYAYRDAGGTERRGSRELVTEEGDGEAPPAGGTAFRVLVDPRDGERHRLPDALPARLAVGADGQWRLAAPARTLVLLVLAAALAVAGTGLVLGPVLGAL